MHEFMKALCELGLEASEGAIAAVFQTFDPNGDGQIEYSEMHDLLVRSVQSHPKLEPLDVKATNRLKLRKKRVRKQDANMFSGAITSDKNICGQIRTALHDRLARVIDLFRQVRSRRQPVVSSSEYHPSLSTDPHRALSSARL